MYLIDGDNLYSFNTSKEDILDFRKKELSSIPELRRLFLAETIVRDGEIPLFSRDNRYSFTSTEANNEDNRDYYHVLYNFNYGRNDLNTTFDKYYNDKYRDRPLIEISSENNTRYFMLLNIYYSMLRRYDDGRSKHIMTSIMELTSDLYSLELLLNGQSDRLENRDMSKVFDLFEFEKIDNSFIKVEGIRDDKLLSLIKKYK